MPTMPKDARNPRVRATGVESLERRVLLAVIYVDDTAAGPAHDGRSWATAYAGLQDALDTAAASEGPDSVHVAAGTYRPTARTDPEDPRSATFNLASGVSILGGFPDGGGTAAQRDPAAHVVTLSGGGNSYRVVTAVGVDRTAVLDGLYISGGMDGHGAGMYCEGSPTLTDCTFAGNSGYVGGGMYNTGSPVLTRCTFTGNSARNGGGMYNDGRDARPTLTDCTFSRNDALWGGGMFNSQASLTLTNCTFDRNTAASDGGMANLDVSSATLTNCTFIGNAAGVAGAMSFSGFSLSVTNCTFTGNSAQNSIGGIAIGSSSTAAMTNCIFWGNWARDGRVQISSRTATVRHSIVEGGWVGEGNMDADPLFVRDYAAGPDESLEDDDPGDLRLRPGSPAVDAGDTAAVPDGVTTDRAGLPRVRGRAVDMGAHEVQPAGDGEPYEAELGAVSGAKVSAIHPGFTGGGYVDYAHAAGDAVEFTVDAPSAGQYDLAFRYALGGSSPRTMGLAVDGEAAPSGVTFAPTASWRAWDTAAVTVRLRPGLQTVRLFADGQSGPNLDALTVAPARPGAARYEAEAAGLSGAKAAAAHRGYAGAGYADYRHASGDFVEFTIDVAAAGTYALDFRYANGGSTDRPLHLNVDDPSEPDLSFAPTGSWRQWRVATRTVVLAAGRHTIRLTAVGQGGPNLDALTVRPAGA